MVLRLPAHLYRLSLVGILFALSVTTVHAQVSVAPTGLFLSEQSRFGNVYVSNGSQRAQQVEMQFQFGYPASDSTGSVYMNYEDSTAAETYSLSPYLKAFPQQFSLPPGESQVVRVVASPLGDRSAGMYWTRLITASEPQVEDVDTTAEGVSARVVFRLRQVTSVLYRKGNVSVRAQMNGLEASVFSDTLRVGFTVDREGNAPFLGLARIRALNSGGEPVVETQRALAVYFDSYRLLDVGLGETDAADISEVEVTLNTERTDIPSEYRLSMQPISETVSVARR